MGLNRDILCEKWDCFGYPQIKKEIASNFDVTDALIKVFNLIRMVKLLKGMIHESISFFYKIPNDCIL